MSVPMTISTTPETRGDDDVAVADPAERRRRAVEGERGQQERDREAERVEREQQRRRGRRCPAVEAAARIDASVGPTHGVQAPRRPGPR